MSEGRAVPPPITPTAPPPPAESQLQRSQNLPSSANAGARGVPTSAAVSAPNTPQHNNNNDPSPTAPKLQQQNSSSYQVGNIQLPITRVQDQGSIWLFIQRNYSRGIEVQFSTEFPQELKDAVILMNRGSQWGHHGKNLQFSNLQIRKNTAVIYKYTIYCVQYNNFIPSDL